MSSSVTGGVLLDDLLVGHTRSEGIENDEDRDARALDARLTMANLRVNRDALQELLSLRTSHLHEQCYERTSMEASPPAGGRVRGHPMRCRYRVGTPS
jgi:hypothetical protein